LQYFPPVLLSHFNINIDMDDDQKNDDVSAPTEDLFNKLGLSVQYGRVEVGQTYPIYGMITEFLCEDLGAVVVMVNHNIEVFMGIDDLDKVNVLKNRSFDPGIFICVIDQAEPVVKGTCTTVVFGKNDKESH